VWGLGARQDVVHSAYLLAGDGRVERSSLRAFFNAEWTPLSSLVVNAGTMLEHYRGLNPELSPRISVNLHLSPRHTLIASAGRGTRMPALPEAFGQVALRYQDGSLMYLFSASAPKVRPEHIDSLEIGYLGSLPRWGLDVDLRLFHREVRDWIQQVSDPSYPQPIPDPALAQQLQQVLGGVYVNENVGHYRTDGLEAALEAQPLEAMHLRVAYSQTHSRSVAINKVSPLRMSILDDHYAPKETLSVLGWVDLPHRVQLGVGYYRVATMDWLGEGDIIPGFSEWDARLAKTLHLGGSDLQLALVLRNMGGRHQDFQRENWVDRRALVELSLDLP
jgi:iron complex outermembrane receptor protein